MKLSKTSLEKLSTCDPYLQMVIKEAIKITPVDSGVAQGWRSVDQQRQYFKEGKSKIDPDKYDPNQLIKKAKHVVNELARLSRAVDVFAYIPGKGASWNVEHLCVIAGVILAVDKMHENRLRWGGNWDMDGEIISDQNFQDLPHFELIK